MCKTCGAVFDSLRVYRERRGEFWGAEAYEEFLCCPVCLEADYIEFS